MCVQLFLFPGGVFFSHSRLSALSGCLPRLAFALFLHQLLAFHVMQSHSCCQRLEDRDVEIYFIMTLYPTIQTGRTVKDLAEAYSFVFGKKL